MHASLDRQAFCREQGLDPQKNLVTVLPGSRAAELRQHLHIIREACHRIHRDTQAQFVIAAAPGSNVAALREGWPADAPVKIVVGQTYNALAAADAAIEAGGDIGEAECPGLLALVRPRVGQFVDQLGGQERLVQADESHADRGRPDDAERFDVERHGKRRHARKPRRHVALTADIGHRQVTDHHDHVCT